MTPAASLLSFDRLWRGLAGGLLWAAWLWAPATAGAAEVAVALSRPSGAYLAFVEALQTMLPRGGPHRLLDAGTVDGGLDEAAVGRADLVIAVGPEAAGVLAARGTRPTLAVLLGADNLRALQTRHPGAPLSGIVLDQPLDRQMRLIRAAMPRAGRIGAVLGPHSASLRPAVIEAGQRAGLEMSIEELDDASELLPALERLLQNTDAVLALPDPVAFSLASARTALLTTYRYRRPLIAYSRAYVQAGALAAVYSSPDDAARQVAEWLAGQPGDKLELPAVQEPRHFSVARNEQVARALSLALPDEATLRAAISAGAAP